MTRSKSLFVALSFVLVLFSSPSFSLAAEQPDDASAAPAEKKQIDRQQLTQESSNPLGKLWMMTSQFNVSLPEGPDPKPQLNWNFQPVMTFGLDHDLSLLIRPVLPVYNAPYGGKLGMEDSRVGLGDMEFLAKIGGTSKNSNGFLWGVGPTFVFPTATDRNLGTGKLQLGTVVAAAYMDKDWVFGVFPQQRWSVAGDPDRKEVSQTKAVYFVWYSPIPTWQVGMTPTALVDWKQDKAENAVTLPVGLGVAKLFMINGLPLKVAFETDYSVIRPHDNPGAEWTFHLSLTPIIPELF